MSTAEELESGGALALLSEAAQALNSSLDFEVTLRRLAQLAATALGAMCVIDLARPDGSIRDVAVAADDANLAARLEELRQRSPIDSASAHPVAEVLRSGTPMLLQRMDDAMLATFAASEEHRRLMIQTGYRTAVVAPLSARERMLGTISLVRSDPCEPFTERDMLLVAELAGRAAISLDNARLYSELRQSQRLFEATLGVLAEAVTVHDEEGRVVYANQAAADLLMCDAPEQLMAASGQAVMDRFDVFDESGRRMTLAEMPGRRVLAGQEAGPVLTRAVFREDGTERWMLTKASPLLDADTGKPTLAVNVIEDVTEEKRAGIDQRFLTDASAALGSSLDLRETLERVAQLVVPELADWCAVDLADEAGALEHLAVFHRDPQKVAVARQLQSEYPPDLDDPSGVGSVVRQGRSVLYLNITPALLAEGARDQQHLRLLEQVGTTSTLIVPMRAGARILGAITLAMSDSGRTLSDRDVALAEELARRAGVAIENARLYTERNRIAKTLQAALLPAQLPEVPGVEVAVRYRAAGFYNDVGGDFYDVFETEPGRWVVVVGDVCGKGARAAAITALARYTLRALAPHHRSPASLLTALHEVLAREHQRRELCTLCAAVVTPGAGGAEATLALAGHPRPLLISPEAEPRPVGVHGTLLGMLQELRIIETTLRLAPGETLLLYTDGVTDAGSPQRSFGEEGLAAVVSPRRDEPLEDMLAGIEAEVVLHSRGVLRDDVALLAVRPWQA